MLCGSPPSVFGVRPSYRPRFQWVWGLRCRSTSRPAFDHETRNGEDACCARPRTAANHIPASKPDPPAIEPAQNVTITIDLPAFLRNVTAFEATENGLTPFPCRVENGKAILKLESIESGRVFMLKDIS